MAGRVVVDQEMCKGCGLCVSVCPNKVLAQGDGLNKKGYRYVTAADEAGCVGCGLCAMMCPDLALTVWREVG